MKAVFARNEATVRAGVLHVALGDYSERPVITVQWGPLYADHRRSPEFRGFMREAGFPPQCRPIAAKDGGADDFACE